MMKDSIQRDLLFMEALKKETFSKGELFSSLSGVIGKDKDLRAMHLPTSANIIRLQSNLIKGKFKLNQPRIAGYLSKILDAENGNRREELGVMLKALTPQPNEYAVMAMDNYLSQDSKHTVEGFYSEYESFRIKELIPKAKNHETEHQDSSKIMSSAVRNSYLQGSIAVM